MYLYDTEYILSSNVLTATLTALFYDFLITWDEEVNSIWTQPFTFGTWLFLFNRYMPFVDTFLGVYLTFVVTTPQRCYDFLRGNYMDDRFWLDGVRAYHPAANMGIVGKK